METLVRQTIDRRELMLADADTSSRILEIGAGYSPLVTRAQGYNVKYLDHLDKAGLVAKYDGNQSTDHIEDVDYVWSGEPYAELMKDQTFDVVVASHCIEHQPDLIGWIKNVENILSKDGVFSLAIPDRRFTFDYNRPRSSFSGILDAHVEKRTQPTIGSVMEQEFYATARNGLTCWTDVQSGEISYVHPDPARAHEKRKLAEREYTDVHVWVFTASWARLIMADLYELGYIKLRESGFFMTDHWEFFLQLSLSGTGPDVSREMLTERALRETRW